MEGVPSDLGPVIEGLVTVVVGTRDRELNAEAVLAAAAVPEPGGRLRVYVPERTGARTFENLRETGVASVLLERPLTHRSVQLKGRCVAIRTAEDAERPVAERGMTAFFEHVEQLGIPPDAVRRHTHWPCRVVTVEVRELYEQTPGPRAGMPYAG